MIAFFRKIRQSLLQENHLGKYLIYAFGEITLVMIGILLALQVNNWNDQQKNAEAELEYYCKILADFELDKELINQLKDKADNRIAVSKELLLDLDSGTKDKSYLLNKFLIATRSDAYVPRNVTFKDLISSGNLKLLNDVSLKNSLIQYYSELENKQSQLKENRTEVLNTIFDMINTSPEFGGIQELDYVKNLLDAEIMQTLPQVDWTKDKNSSYYKEFQMFLVFNLSMAEREKQHLSAINGFMETPYQLLTQKCEATN